jgi:hypothetical protein
MARGVTFADIVELTDSLNLEQKEELMDVLRQRTRQARRKALIRRVRQAEKEFRQGKYKVVRATDIMAEIME